jgi:integrase
VLEPAASDHCCAIWSYEGQPLTRAALQLSALLFQRPGNIRHMEWREIDFDSARWTIPAAKMKRSVQGKESGRPHLVPLAARRSRSCASWSPSPAHGRYVFTSLLSGERR